MSSPKESDRQTAIEMLRVTELARDLGVHKQTVFKVLKRLQIQPAMVNWHDARGQKVAALTKPEAQLVISELDRTTPADSSSLLDASAGFFYLIQLEPELEPGRYKVGFTQNPAERLRAHRTSAPLVKIIDKWPCKARWERTAIDYVANESEQLGVEVFRCDDIGQAEQRCREFFNLMPDV